MSTNAKLPTCDIKTDHVIPNEAADVSSEVEISSDMPVTKNIVKKKQDKPYKGSELFLDQLGLSLTETIILMLDVTRYVTNVERTNHLKSGSRNLGQSIRVTLWGSLGDVLIEKKTKQTGVCPVILSATCPKKYKVYLSSTSSTVIYDDDAIPAIKALKKANSVVNHQTFRTSVDLSQPQTGTLENLLMYRLKVDVSDNTAQVVVVMFNETATALVNCSADSLMDTVDEVQFRRTSLTGFPAQSIRSSNAIALDSPYLLVLITGMSQSRQH
nr:hypothetical protein [Tanacetum cinerariifolium]